MDTIELETREAVAIVRLDRPPVNAVTRQMMPELRQVFEELSDNRAVRAVVFGANGERAFCGGIDLKETAAGRELSEESPVRATMDPGWEWRQTQHAIRHCTVPVDVGHYTNRLRGYNDSREAMQAFLDKREPKWTWS
jgi:enoyl-CoA hydratase